MGEQAYRVQQNFEPMQFNAPTYLLVLKVSFAISDPNFPRLERIFRDVYPMDRMGPVNRYYYQSDGLSYQLGGYLKIPNHSPY